MTAPTVVPNSAIDTAMKAKWYHMVAEKIRVRSNSSIKLLIITRATPRYCSVALAVDSSRVTDALLTRGPPIPSTAACSGATGSGLFTWTGPEPQPERRPAQVERVAKGIRQIAFVRRGDELRMAAKDSEEWWRSASLRRVEKPGSLAATARRCLRTGRRCQHFVEFHGTHLPAVGSQQAVERRKQLVEMRAGTCRHEDS